MFGTPLPNRDRFLAAIAERVSPDRVQALYLFAPIRQGTIETGVAVLAVDPLVPVPVEDGMVQGPGSTVQRAADGEPAAADTELAPPIPDTRYPIPDTHPLPDPRDPRPVVLTARYRHTLKGPDRGKWTCEIHEQADAPLATLERVMQGVQERLDERVEPERLDAGALRAAQAEGVWTPPQR